MSQDASRAVAVNNDQTAQEAAAAAKVAAEKATEQAREFANEAVATIKTLDTPRLVYVASLATVVVSTLVFDMLTFSVGVDGPVSETVAQAQREVQARMNSLAYSAFSSTLWGKLMWLSAAAGVGLVLWSAVKKSGAAWVPLAQIGCAGLATLLLLLLMAVGVPDLSQFDDASASTTVLGYWVPLAAAGMATFFSVQRLLKA